ncbi:PREDICTED: dual specificity protein phosphatase 4 [Aptenodytes forsteri]|nr:PREDICTED: dual specificity protein phosphatase 4 [Aptenodytes forsteri]
MEGRWDRPSRGRRGRPHSPGRWQRLRDTRGALWRATGVNGVWFRLDSPRPGNGPDSPPTSPGTSRCPFPVPSPTSRGPPGITLCASFLAGGYERFSSEYPEFCAKTKSLSNVSPPTSAEPLDLGCSSCGTPLHDQGGPVEILPFLYLGSAYHAARRDMLDALGITALLNVSSDCPNHFEGHYQYKCIPVEDNHKADISSWFMEAIEYIDSVKECCGRVLVHCQAGISRSATICLAYLMMKKRVKLEEAFEFVKQRRSIISPNFSFMGQLLQFESQVLATSCAVEAVSPSGTLRERGKATSTPTSQFVFSFPVSVGVHATPSSLPYLHSPITTSPSC